MAQFEERKKITELIKKLFTECDIDKCQWQRHLSSLNNQGTKFMLQLKSGCIIIGRDVIYVHNNNHDCISEYKPTNEAGDQLNSLWIKVREKVYLKINEQVLSIIDELDKL